MKESSVTHAMKSVKSTAFTAIIFLVLGMRLALVPSLHQIAGWMLGIALLAVISGLWSLWFPTLTISLPLQGWALVLFGAGAVFFYPETVPLVDGLRTVSSGLVMGVAALMILIPWADRFREWRQKRGSSRA